MEDLLPKQSFFARHEFEGNLSKRDEVADKLHVVVQYSLIKEGEIVGKVLGTGKTFKKLGRLLNLPGPYLKLTSEKIEHITTDIFSDKVLLRKTTHRVWPPGYGERMISIVSDLIFENITITEHYGTSDSLERHLTFFLAGPRRLWQVHEDRKLSFTGEIKSKVQNSKIELNADLPFEIEVVPSYFYDKTLAPDNHELTTKVLVLHLKTKESVEQFSNEDFVNSGKSLADDLTLLVSFLSRHWVTWYRYELQTSDILETYVRRTRECSTNELGWDDTLVEWREAREFLKVGFRNLRKLRAEGLDLSMPIVYCVSGNEAKYLEEQFTTFFLSLEKIKDMFALKPKKHLRENLPDKAFKKLRSLISDVIEKNVESSEVVERIQTKIPELNRPSLRFVLESLFHRYNVDWTDIYPQASGFTLIKTRDELFHSSRALNIDLLVKELHRLQAIIERLLLRMMGWDDLSRSPTDFMKKWLTAVDNDSNDT